MKKNKTIPYYSKKNDKWRVKIKMEYKGKDCIQTEEGDLEYVVCEYLATSLYYPFWLDEDRNTDRDFQPHDHSFNDVLTGNRVNNTASISRAQYSSQLINI